MKNDVFWTVYNETDDRIVDNAPLFTRRGPARDWKIFNDNRLTSMVIRVRVTEMMS